MKPGDRHSVPFLFRLAAELLEHDDTTEGGGPLLSTTSFVLILIVAGVVGLVVAALRGFGHQIL